MLSVDMGSLPEATFENELFGHRKGAFTDVKSDRAGRFQAASGGSLFLDEIGNMPLPAQAKLLTALERREVTPLGADRAEAIDVRIISATNLPEARLFDQAVFRADLLFRLNTIVIRVPPCAKGVKIFHNCSRTIWRIARSSITSDHWDLPPAWQTLYRRLTSPVTCVPCAMPANVR